MKKLRQHIEIEIDKLTNSVENVITGDSFPTEVVMFEKEMSSLLPRHMVGYLTGKKNINILTEMFIN